MKAFTRNKICNNIKAVQLDVFVIETKKLNDSKILKKELIMELKNALEQLGLLQKKLYAYQTASSSLYLDSVTVAPKDTSEGRGVALGILAGESQKLMTAPETGELL